MEMLQSVVHKATLSVPAMLANAGLSGQGHNFHSLCGADGLNRLAVVRINLQGASLSLADAIYSSQWFGALCVVLALVAAVGVLWLRFTGAQKREKS